MLSFNILLNGHFYSNSSFTWTCMVDVLDNQRLKINKLSKMSVFNGKKSNKKTYPWFHPTGKLLNLLNRYKQMNSFIGASV